MIIRLLASQIPQVWGAIKYAAVQADEVDSKDVPFYLLELLHSLMSDKSQVFVRLDKNRAILGVLVTRMSFNKISGKKSLHLQCLYSWKAQSYDTWQGDFVMVKTFAKKAGCDSITFNSRNYAVREIAQKAGFQEQTRLYELAI